MSIISKLRKIATILIAILLLVTPAFTLQSGLAGVALGILIRTEFLNDNNDKKSNNHRSL